jgi:Ca2+-transporting ATPase
VATAVTQPVAPDAAWYHLTGEDAAARLGVEPATGLSAQRAQDLLAQHGPNELPAEQTTPGWRRFLNQYRSYMQLILVGAAVVSLAIQEWTTATMLVAITVLNAVVSLRQEGKAESAMNALKAMVKATARVRRDGIDVEVAAEEIVPGDVILLTAGDDVAADGRIVEASALQIDESALTGESTPAAKEAGPLSGEDLSPGDQTNMAFMHTPVTHGSGVIVVTATGADTEVGKIAGMLSGTAREETPLTRQLNTLTLWIAGAAGITMVFMFVLGAQRGQPADQLFTAAVALAIAAIPEAMPTVLQVILSLGAGDLAQHGAIVKDLTSVETLGSTSAINSDKTGTLTLNQVTAVEVVTPGDRYTVSGEGYALDGQVHHAAGSSGAIDDGIAAYVHANDARLVDGHVVGDPTEGALLVLAHKAGLDIEGTRERAPRLATLPFDPTYKLMAAFCQGGDGAVRCFVKGAAPALIARSAALVPDAGRHVERMEGQGLKVMAAAVRDLDAGTFDAGGDLLAYVDGLEMTSIVGLMDPPRAESKDAVADAKLAHIRVRMVTGDDVITGAAIAERVGIEGEAILGAEFAALSEAERLERIDHIGVVGRVAPEHKVLLVDTLKKRRDVVAMTGDGVNDAPAIKAAHIGIAMGSGTEVAKNAGRMILSDDNFATIVRAIRQGRKLYDNLSKYVRFVLITLVAFVLTFLGATLLDINGGQPFSSPQVLWIHFVFSAPFGIALGLDHETPGLMRLRPRGADSSIMSRSLLTTAGLVGLYMAIVLDLLIAFGKSHFGSYAVGSSIGLTAFALMIVVASYQVRNARGSTLVSETFDNRTLNITAAAEIFLALLVTQMDAFHRLLGTTDLSGPQFLLALAAAAALFVLWELGKLVTRRR